MARRAGSVGIQRSPRWAVGVGLVLLLALFYPAVPASAQEEGAVLYLTERPFENTHHQWNFTMMPADQNESGRDRSADQKNFPTFAANWNWFLPRTPENWSVEEGSEWEFVLYIEGLDLVHPLPGSLVPPSMHPGSYEITIQVADGEESIASGSLEVLVLDVDEGIQRYTVPVTYSEDKTFERSDDDPEHLLIDIQISGRGTDPESPLVLHFGSTEHPSRVSAPSYPHEAFRAMELDFLAGQECNELLLHQESCKKLADDGDDEIEETTVPNENTGTQRENETDPDTQNSPGPGLLLLGAGFLLFHQLLRQARRPLRGNEAN